MKVEHDVAAVLPDGLRTPDVWIWAVKADGGRSGRCGSASRRGLWLYDITIDDAEREGYGRGAMLALENEVRVLGHETWR